MPGTATLDQRRARHAWEAVARGKQLPTVKGTDYAREYARETKRLPVRIVTSGLGATVAFLRAKDRAKRVKARDQLVGDVAAWLLVERGIGVRKQSASSSDLVRAIVEGDSEFLRRATEETLLYCQWLSRFAEAEIDDDDEG